MEVFKKYNIDIRVGISDGFQGVLSFIELMKKKFPNYLHIFDYPHVVKLIRL